MHIPILFNGIEETVQTGQLDDVNMTKVTFCSNYNDPDISLGEGH